MVKNNKASNSFPNFPLAELHAHLGASVSPTTYWQIAHDQGFKLPKRDYHEFIDFVTLSPERKMTMKDYFDQIYHPVLDTLSSGTFAVETAVFEIMSGAYRSSNITLMELRLNPMKHNHEGQEDLDHIIMACLRGMERALLQFPKLSAGLIFCLDRQFSFEKNKIIVEKAIKYKRRGVVGIDFANYGSKSFKFKDYGESVNKAKKAGLKVTVHSGETPDTNDIWDALKFINPQRIGHGVLAYKDEKLMKELSKRGVVLEVCPLSNIVTKAVKDLGELIKIFKAFKENKVKFTIKTDWPEMIENAHLDDQFKMLLDEGILTEKELIECNETAFKSTFIPKGGLNAYL